MMRQASLLLYRYRHTFIVYLIHVDEITYLSVNWLSWRLMVKRAKCPYCSSTWREVDGRDIVISGTRRENMGDSGRDEV